MQLVLLELGKFAKFLIQNGHDVKILSSKHYDLKETLKIQIDRKRIQVTDWLDFFVLKK